MAPRTRNTGLLAHVSGRSDKKGSDIGALVREGTIPTTAAPEHQGGRTSGSRSTRDIEEAIWGPGKHFVYFYVGRWIDRYGSFGIGYSGPGTARGHATPWDTGWRYKELQGKGAEVAAQAVRGACIPLTQWRPEFARHLEQNPSYLDSAWEPGPAHLFEVRREGAHPLVDDLVMWDGDDDTRMAFASMYRKNGDNPVLVALGERVAPSSHDVEWCSRLHLEQQKLLEREGGEP